MEKFVALLRGINVGRSNRVPMAELRSLLEQLGYGHIATLLNSGNATFCAPAELGVQAETAIGQALTNEMGVSVPVIVKSAHQLEQIVSSNPNLAVAEPSRLLVVFASRQEDLEALGVLESLLMRGESLYVTPHAAYLYCAAGISASKAAAALRGKLGRNVTTRNWTTVLKITAALSGMPA